MKKIVALSVIFLIFSSFHNKSFAQEIETVNNTALIIIDIQNFYFPNGILPLHEPEKAAINAQKVLNKCRSDNALIIHIKHNAKSGSEIHNLVKPLEKEIIITKDKANAFVDTDLLKILKKNNIKNVVLCGMQTHMCLEAATRAASDYGFSCTVIEDACTTRNLTFGEITIQAKDVHYSTLSSLNKTYAEILTTEDYLKK